MQGFIIAAFIGAENHTSLFTPHKIMMVNGACNIGQG